MALLPAAIVIASAMSSEPHGHSRHGNPADLEAYIARMEEPARAQWQKPDEVVAALQLQAGQVACDVGAGPGYFALRLARAVGAGGRVFAVDVEPRILEVLRERIQSAGVRNVTPVLSLADDSLLPDGACDLILIVDTYHHFPDGPAYLRRLSQSLRPGGRVVNIDFHKRALPVGPPIEHKIARETFLKDAAAAGLVLASEHQFLPYQYFVVLTPRRR
jgi:ubiquinone/menaquinone biosynthesis C-methylase UbiE